SIDSPGIIQKKLINDIPELLWIGVHKKGTTFILEGGEKIVEEEEEVDGPRNLVATKKGVISKMHVSKGKPQVAVDEYVEPGDVLVSGKLDLSDDADDKKEPTLIAAEGDIRARTWYETSVTVPLEVNYEVLTGERKRKYFIQRGAVKVPVWGFGKPDYDAFHRESDTSALHFLKWKLPIKFDVTTLSEKEYRKVERTKDEAIDHGLEQARRELRLQLGPDAEIISEKILHEIDLQLSTPNEALALFGNNDKHLKQIEEQLHVSIVTRGEKVGVSGTREDRALVEDVLGALLSVIKKGLAISERDVAYAVDL